MEGGWFKRLLKGEEPFDEERRKFLKGAAATAALSAAPLSSAEAQPHEYQFLDSALTQSELEDQKTGAARELVEGAWEQPHLRAYALEHYFQGAQTKTDAVLQLRQQSTMYIPSAIEREDVCERWQEKMNELVQKIPERKYGLFIDGDTQRLYIIHNVGNNKMQFVKAYLVSTSKKEWSNKKDSGGTPRELHYVANKEKKFLGEVISARNPHEDILPKVPILLKGTEGQIEEKSFSKSLSAPDIGIAEVVTASYLLLRRQDPSTTVSRGVKGHGSNRPSRLGNKASGGCVRQAIPDVVDTLRYLEAGTIENFGEDGGSPVMIVGTPGREVFQPKGESTKNQEPEQKIEKSKPSVISAPNNKSRLNFDFDFEPKRKIRK